VLTVNVSQEPSLTDQGFWSRSLSRSGKKILHVDQHGYYGGSDAGLGLQDAEKWAEEVNKCELRWRRIFTSETDQL